MKKIVEIVLHLLFWFVILVVFPYVTYIEALKNGYMPDKTFYDFMVMRTTLTNTMYFAGYLVGFYALYFTVSYTLHKKRIVRFGLYLGWSILISIPLYLITTATIIYVIFTSFFIIFSTAGIFAAVVKGIILWLLDISEKRILQKRQLESENALLLLKAQLNPHFLFNSLNNIDILIEESPKIASD